MLKYDFCYFLDNTRTFLHDDLYFFLAIVLIFDSPYSLDPGLIFIFMNSCVAGDSHMLNLPDSFHSSKVIFSSVENLLLPLFFSIVQLMLNFQVLYV